MNQNPSGFDWGSVGTIAEDTAAAALKWRSVFDPGARTDLSPKPTNWTPLIVGGGVAVLVLFGLVIATRD